MIGKMNFQSFNSRPPNWPQAPRVISSSVIRFTPESQGDSYVTVRIANNDSNENPFTFIVQGTGREGGAQGNPNEPPTDIALDNAGVAENEAIGTKVGTFKK